MLLQSKIYIFSLGFQVLLLICVTLCLIISCVNEYLLMSCFLLFFNSFLHARTDSRRSIQVLQHLTSLDTSLFPWMCTEGWRPEGLRSNSCSIHAVFTLHDFFTVAFPSLLQNCGCTFCGPQNGVILCLFAYVGCGSAEIILLQFLSLSAILHDCFMHEILM